MKRHFTHRQLLVSTTTLVAEIFYFIRPSTHARRARSPSNVVVFNRFVLFETDRSQPFFTFPARLDVFFKARFVQIMFFAKRTRIDFRNRVALMILETFCISERFHAARTLVIR